MEYRTGHRDPNLSLILRMDSETACYAGFSDGARGQLRLSVVCTNLGVTGIDVDADSKAGHVDAEADFGDTTNDVGRGVHIHKEHCTKYASLAEQTALVNASLDGVPTGRRTKKSVRHLRSIAHYGLTRLIG